MPPRTEKYENIEARIRDALADLAADKYATVAAAASDYNVPYDRLRRRLAGTQSKCDRPGAGRLLNPT